MCKTELKPRPTKLDQTKPMDLVKLCTTDMGNYIFLLYIPIRLRSGCNGYLTLNWFAMHFSLIHL